MRVYLAAAYRRREEIKEYANQLQRLGILIGAEWLNETADPNSSLGDTSPKELSNLAMKDWWDIGACDVFIFFAEEQTKQPPRGGRHFEMGVAACLGKPIVVIGKPENIFHYLPGFRIDHFDTWESAKQFLNYMNTDFYEALKSMGD